MIIIDFAHLSFKSLFVALDKEAFSKNKVDFKKYKGMFIHLMFNYLKLVQTEFSKDYGNDIILALEGSSSWRKEFYPKYKANRVLNIFTRRAILNVGMLLTTGEIAHQVRTSLLNMSENKEAIQQEVSNIDKEKLLALDVLYAKTDNERMVNLGKFINYKDEQKAKIEAEKRVAVEKVENLTKSDATMGLREAKNNLGVKEKSLRNFILENKYCYRKHKKDDKKGNPTGVLMPYEQYTKGDTRYFTIIKQIDRIGNPHSQMVFTIDGIEHFRKLKSEIEKF